MVARKLALSARVLARSCALPAWYAPLDHTYLPRIEHEHDAVELVSMNTGTVLNVAPCVGPGKRMQVSYHPHHAFGAVALACRNLDRE